MRIRAYRGLVAAVAAASAVTLPMISVMPAAADPDPAAFSASIKVPAVRGHLEKLQQIADVSGGIRASGNPGHEASVTYVADRLRAAGYQVTLQEFEFPYFRELTPSVLNGVSPGGRTYTRDTDFAVMTYSGSGNVTAPVQGVDLVLPPSPVPNYSTSGCEASDFAGFTAGNIALLQRGTCDFQVKAGLAQAAGASGVIIFNEGQPGAGLNDRRTLLTGTLNAPTMTIPVVGATFAVGAELAATGAAVTLTTDTEGDPHRRTRNVLAESRWGDPGKVVMLGAHLDSVTKGPGINDNGSGSAAVLETALKAGALPTRNRLRFAFWGAEELGLLGSRHYVATLSPEEKAKIRLYLNFDMIASPNYTLGIYDGDNSDAAGAPAGPAGSDTIEKLFESYYRSIGRPYTSTDFTGRSDYGPFIAVGIPAGGLFTGAEGIKTAEEAARFGGQAGVAYDRCYHQACDTIANVNDEALAINAGAVATAAFVYAYSDTLPGGGTPTSTWQGIGGGGLRHDHDGVSR
ncbi:M28 family metallopeptidase [Streptosporangium sp. NBC_01756]|uniref:M28 family metallopeptidase n=1 Tax=Streptosporangium sp. NBC_01756 TaxID=2975950 RepID=UPI002DDB7EAA|nr:M28 family metallopeptidase [Streptosporangium sp. NBC_01756]WSC89816.1 M28 family metallopeptidase [Streptosporangium sp. NBC_01756]